MAEFVLTPQIKALALRTMQELKGEIVFIVNKTTSKPVRLGDGGRITANGGLGKNAQFKVHRKGRHAHGPVVAFQCVANGKFLAIKGGELTVGGGGDHCEFIVEMRDMAVFLRKHHNPKVRMGFNGDGSAVPCNNVADGDRGRFFIFDADAVVRVGGGGGGGGGGHHHPQPHHPHPQQAHHPHPHPQPVGFRPAKPHPQQKFLLKISDQNLFVVANGGLKDGSACQLLGAPAHPKAHTRPAAQWVLLKTAFPGTFLIKSAHSPLCLHILGGSKEKNPLALHGDEKYARQHPNSKFHLVPAGGADFLMKIQDKDLCVHGVGGSKDGVAVALHGDQRYNAQHGNGKFQFIPI